MKFPAVFPYIIIFLIYIAFTLVWAVNPYEGFSTILHWSICSLAIFIAANIVNKDHLLLTIFLSGAGVAIVGLLQHYTGFDFFQQVTKPSSTFGNKNFAAHYVAACLPLGFYFANKYRLLFILAGVILMLTYISICDTRAAMLAVLIAAIFGLVVCIYKRIYSRLSLVVFAVIIILTFIYGDFFHSPPRIEIWKNTASMARDNTYGVGIGNFKIIYSAYNNGKIMPNSTKEQVEYAHNEYAQLWAETGFCGVLLLSLMSLGIMRAINFKSRHWLYVAASIICICIVSFFSMPIRLPMMPYIGSCMLGVLSK